jgi:hypothetical protein
MPAANHSQHTTRSLCRIYTQPTHTPSTHRWKISRYPFTYILATGLILLATGSMKQTEIWNRNFSLLPEFHRQHGHCNVPFGNATLRMLANGQHGNEPLKHYPRSRSSNSNRLDIVGKVKNSEKMKLG